MCGNFLTPIYNTPICAICLNELHNLPDLYVLNCGHVYCRLCLLNINRSFLRFKIIKCPQCCTYHTCTQCMHFDFKCKRCRKNLLQIEACGKTIVHLTCGHFYCLDCVFKISNCIVAKCEICLTKHIVNPLFL
jgi:hypothetical protein